MLFFSVVVQVSLGSGRNPLLLMVPFGNDFEEGFGFMLKMFILVKYWKTRQVRVTKKLNVRNVFTCVANFLQFNHWAHRGQQKSYRYMLCRLLSKNEVAHKKKALKIIFSYYSSPLESSWRQFRTTRDKETVARVQDPLHQTISSASSWGMLLPGFPHHFNGKMHAITGV